MARARSSASASPLAGLDRRARYELAQFGDAIGDPSRAAMLVALIGGTARPASELARLAAIAPSTATAHLRRLVEQGLIVGRARGRHRYYELAGERVATAVEALIAAGITTGPTIRTDSALAIARTCYAHLAGRVAIALWARAADAGWMRWSGSTVQLRGSGRDALAPLFDDAARVPAAGRACLDWSERVPHVSGPLGGAVCAALIERRWLARVPGDRALRITTRGRDGLRRLGVRWRDQ